MLSVFPAHAVPDALLVRELCAFLQSGCNADCSLQDAVTSPGHDLLAIAEVGLSADILILLLSNASSPARWVRTHWEPLLFGMAAEARTHVAILLLEPCEFPQVLRRKLRFFDATGGLLPAFRCLKRWIWSVERGEEATALFAPMSFAPDLEALYRELADQPGTYISAGELAARFAGEAASDFEAVFWVPAHGKTLAQIAGALGAQLHVPLDRPLPESCQLIRDALAGKRCLVVFDAPQVAVDPIVPHGRTSLLFTSEPVHMENCAPSLAAARGFLRAGSLAAAYEMLYQLVESGIEPGWCARELIWICEHWERLEEANALRFHLGPAPSEQLRLF